MKTTFQAYAIETDMNGIAKLTVKNDPKISTAKITFDGRNYIGCSKSIKIKIVKPIITASKLVIHKKGNCVVTFKDANKKAIKNTKVKFTKINIIYSNKEPPINSLNTAVFSISSSLIGKKFSIVFIK